jgi:hypothetical protein
MLYQLMDQVTSGDINGRNIYGTGKRILVKEDITLTAGVILKLKKLGISGIFVKNNKFPHIKMEENVSQETKIETLACLYYVVDMINSNVEIDLEPIKENVDKLIQEIQDHKNISVQFTDIRSRENEVFIHTLQVCIVATTIATKLNISKDGLKTITTTALLHKVIKNDNSKKHLRKLSKTGGQVHTLYSQMKQKIDFFLIHSIPLPPYKSHANKDIQRYAEILALADCIDSLSSQFSDTPTLAPHEAIEFIMVMTEKIFHLEVINAFIRSFSAFPNGHTVQLNNGKSGLVIRQNTALPTRPVVGVFEGDFLKEEAITFSVEEFDLSKLTTVFITDMENPNSSALDE